MQSNPFHSYVYQVTHKPRPSYCFETSINHTDRFIQKRWDSWFEIEEDGEKRWKSKSVTHTQGFYWYHPKTFLFFLFLGFWDGFVKWVCRFCLKDVIFFCWVLVLSCINFYISIIIYNGSYEHENDLGWVISLCLYQCYCAS